MERGPAGCWTNSMGYSMAPMDGDLTFHQDGTGQISIFYGPEGEFEWARKGPLEFEIWNSPGEHRYAFQMSATEDGCWFTRVDWDSPQRSELAQDIADILELGPWYRTRLP